MRGKENLHPKVMRDKNGRLTTVWVSKDGVNAPSPAMKASASVPPPPVTKRPVATVLNAGRFAGEGGHKNQIDHLFGYQEEIADAVLDHLKTHDRASASAACGMGKTVIAQDIIRRDYEDGAENGVYIFVTDKIRLTDQSAKAFDENARVGKHAQFVVHSKSEDVIAYRNANPHLKDASHAEVTDEAIREFLETPVDGPLIIFVTYDSASHVAKLQREITGSEADMVIFDESHRLSGDYEFKNKADTSAAQAESLDTDDHAQSNPSGKVPRVFFNDVDGSLLGNKRVFLTATPSFQQEYDDAWERTKLRRGVKNGVARGHQRWMYETNEAYLQQRAIREDAGENIKEIVHIDQMNTALFGKMVIEKDIRDAMAPDVQALTPIEQVLVKVPSRIKRDPSQPRLDFDQLRVDAHGNQVAGNEGMSAAAYTTMAGTIETMLADDDSRNVLAFLSSTAAIDEYKDNWRSVMNSMIGSNPPSVQSARSLIDSDSGDAQQVRQAKLVLLKEHANVARAYSRMNNKSDAAELDDAYAFFDDEHRACRCGKVGGGWCACAQVVANYDLFGQGIDIKEIDTVIQMNKDRLTDSAITQAVGRAARRKEGKTRGRVVLPVLMAEGASGIDDESALNADQAHRTLNGWSRLNRGVSKAAFAKRSMEAEDTTPVRIIGGNGDDIASTSDLMSGIEMDVVKAHVLARAYKDVKERADTEYKGTAIGGIPWEEMTMTQRQPYYDRIVNGPLGETPFVKMLKQSPYPSYDRELENNARSTLDAVYRRATEYDRESVSDLERSVLWGINRANRPMTPEDIYAPGAATEGNASPEDVELQCVQRYGDMFEEALKTELGLGADDASYWPVHQRGDRFDTARRKQEALRARRAQ